MLISYLSVNKLYVHVKFNIANVNRKICQFLWLSLNHWLINYKGTKKVISSKKKLTCNGTFRQVLIRVYRLEIQYSQSCWYFRPSFVNFSPSNLLFGSPPPPPLKVQYLQTVCGCMGLGGGNWVLLETIFCRSLTLFICLDSEPTKLQDR